MPWTSPAQLYTFPGSALDAPLLSGPAPPGRPPRISVTRIHMESGARGALPQPHGPQCSRGSLLNALGFVLFSLPTPTQAPPTPPLTSPAPSPASGSLTSSLPQNSWAGTGPQLSKSHPLSLEPWHPPPSLPPCPLFLPKPCPRGRSRSPLTSSPVTCHFVSCSMVPGPHTAVSRLPPLPHSPLPKIEPI